MSTERSSPIPLSVLDLVPIVSGSTPAGALANTLDLARRTEAAGYRRYWVAEHHLNPGVAGTTPALVIGLVAATTSRIRVGSGAVLMGHHTPLAVVEQFGLIDAVHPGRIDLGLGRSGFRRPPGEAGPTRSRTGAGAPAEGNGDAPRRPKRERRAWRTDGGLLIPAPFPIGPLLRSPRFAVQASLLQQPGAVAPSYAEQIDEVLALLAGTYCSSDGVDAHVVPGEGADVEVWILGSSGGESAEVAGRRGLPFAANYHVSPATVLDAVEGYRASFCPSAVLRRPYVAVSADVVVAETEAQARELASGYGLWVRSIRTGEGAIAFPTPEEARRHVWTDDDRALVQDRLDTQFVGTPASVADQLEVLAAETGADELVITTITHGHDDRVRSYELLATEWSARAPTSVGDGR
jgi:alkanesulfonate monooxygenase SsuD/methylene tetrahydromethanopterin reductase-like flavin-dependent oxidoreductase (luciferase family)